MNKYLAITITAFLIAAGMTGPSFARTQTFGGYECTNDCLWHAMGYQWAELVGISDQADCARVNGGPKSFREGCLVYVKYPYRGADQDDEGNPIGEWFRREASGQQNENISN